MTSRPSRKLVDQLRHKEFRDEYVAEHAKTGIAFQLRALRQQRDLSQARLGELMGKPQSVVSRLEDPDSGQPTVQSLLDVARALDIALSVQFVSFPEFIRRTNDVSPEALQVESFGKSLLTFVESRVQADASSSDVEDESVFDLSTEPPLAQEFET